jgi:hypothetical protein
MAVRGARGHGAVEKIANVTIELLTEVLRKLG